MGVFRLLISQSISIFDNLALEDLIFEQLQSSSRGLRSSLLPCLASPNPLLATYLLIWRSSPSVVIGRHQNIFSECNISLAHKNKVHVARRKSGGGSVFHDSGNINLSFIVGRSLESSPASQRYQLVNRQINLRLVKDALVSRWPRLESYLEISKRDDILLKIKETEYKISGSASRLATGSGYHHFTLLINSDHSLLNRVLNPPNSQLLETRATPSVRASIANLVDIEPDISCDRFIEALIAHLEKLNGNENVSVASVNPSDLPLHDVVRERSAQLSSADWLRGSGNPDFSLRLRCGLGALILVLRLHVHAGRVIDLSYSVLPASDGERAEVDVQLPAASCAPLPELVRCCESLRARVQLSQPAFERTSLARLPISASAAGVGDSRSCDCRTPCQRATQLFSAPTGHLPSLSECDAATALAIWSNVLRVIDN